MSRLADGNTKSYFVLNINYNVKCVWTSYLTLARVEDVVAVVRWSICTKIFP